MLLIHPERVPGDHPSPGTRARSIGLVLVLAAVVAALVAGATASTTPKPTPAAHQPLTSLPALRKLPPINALVYNPTAADYRITLAEQRLTTACMAKGGFCYHPRPAGQRARPGRGSCGSPCPVWTGITRPTRHDRARPDKAGATSPKPE